MPWRGLTSNAYTAVPKPASRSGRPPAPASLDLGVLVGQVPGLNAAPEPALTELTPTPTAARRQVGAGWELLSPAVGQAQGQLCCRDFRQRNGRVVTLPHAVWPGSVSVGALSPPVPPAPSVTGLGVSRVSLKGLNWLLFSAG